MTIIRRGLTMVPLAALAPPGCAGGVLDPAGPVGAQEKMILLDSLGIMLAIVIPTIVAIFAFAWWFRAGNTRAQRHPDFVYSGRIELIVWAIPLIVVLFLAGLIWVGSHRLDPMRPLSGPAPTLEVQVVSLDWKWLFIYPGQGVASVNRLVIPVGRPVHFTLTSASVMNHFFVPQLGGMISTMNGMQTQLSLQADRPGRFLGQSAQFSGDGFPHMRFAVDAVPPARFVAWSAAARTAGPVLDRTTYPLLAQQGIVSTAFTFRAVDPALFRAIAMQVIPSAPGPHPTVPARSGK